MSLREFFTEYLAACCTDCIAVRAESAGSHHCGEARRASGYAAGSIASAWRAS